MIDATRQRVAIGVNRETVSLYWTIGTRIRRDILQTNRGDYGEKIVQTLSGQLCWCFPNEAWTVESDRIFLTVSGHYMER